MNPETHQIEVTPCRECGGMRAPVTIGAGIGGNITLTATAGSWLNKPFTSTVALVCTQCGIVTMYATKPAVFLAEIEDDLPTT